MPWWHIRGSFDLVRRYAVQGVPKTAINETASIDGALPEPDYVDQIVEGAAMSEQLPSIEPWTYPSEP